jgi:hypothetical protein
LTKLQKIFSHTFSYKVWQIRLVSGTDDLIIEERNEGVPEINYLIYRSGKPMRLVHPMGMEWWSTLIWANKEVILTRTYGEEGNPEHAGIVAYAMRNGQKLWELSKASIQEAGTNVLLVSQEDKNWLIDPLSGTKVSEDIHLVPAQNKTLAYPFRYMKSTPYFDTVGTFIERKYGHVSVHAIEYMEIQGKMIISCYTISEKLLTNNLYVVDSEGNTLLQDILGEKLKGISENTFFVFNGNLIFVNSRNQFFEYSIS